MNVINVEAIGLMLLAIGVPVIIGMAVWAYSLHKKNQNNKTHAG